MNIGGDADQRFGVRLEIVRRTAGAPVRHRLTEPHRAVDLERTKPSDLPVEQPTKFELVVNMRTAKALGLTIPESILVRADKILQ